MSLLQLPPLDERVIFQRACVNCKRIMLVNSLSKKYCKKCQGIMKRNWNRKYYAHKKRCYVKACSGCNFIFITNRKTKTFCARICYDELRFTKSVQKKIIRLQKTLKNYQKRRRMRSVGV